MSQIKFRTEFQGKAAEIMAGWDAPLGYYHFTVFDADPEAEEELLWDGLGNLGFCRKLDTIRETVDTLGLEPPPEFYDLIDRREGNVIYNWDGEQWIRTRL